MKKISAILLIATFLLLPAVSVFAKSFQGVSYTIIEKSSMRSIKLAIDIRLEQKVSKDFLRVYPDLSNELVSKITTFIRKLLVFPLWEWKIKIDKIPF